LIRELGFTKGTIGKALNELVEWGIFTRERPNKEQPFNYHLAVICPDDCQDLELHNTQSELATLPKKQATPSPKQQATPSPIEQATGSPQNRQLIEINKQPNKELNTRDPNCRRCFGALETLPGGTRLLIHSQDCSEFAVTRQGKAWAITRNNLGSHWETLDNRQQQIAHEISLSEFRQRKAKEATDQQTAILELETKFLSRERALLDEHSLAKFLPNTRDYLKHHYLQGSLNESHISRAVDYSRRGLDLSDDPGAAWRGGRMISEDDLSGAEVASDQLSHA